MTLPSSLPAAAAAAAEENAIVMMFIPNEAHESLEDERHKLITDHNPYFIPTNLVIPQRTAISFINADAPWDTPNPYTMHIKIVVNKLFILLMFCNIQIVQNQKS